MIILYCILQYTFYGSFFSTALTDGDQFHVSGSRVLIQDDKLWPMANGELIDSSFDIVDME